MGTPRESRGEQAREVVDRLREETLDVEAQYVNCWRNHTGYRAAYRVLDGLGKAVEITVSRPPWTNSSPGWRPTTGRPAS